MNPESQKLIIITGSNKGIGYGLLQHLAQQPDHFKFIMAVRNLQNGAKALEELSKTIPNIKDKVEVEQLDVSDSASIDKFISTLTKKYGKVDALVNNAGIIIKTGKVINADQARDIFQTNYWGTVELTDKIKPLLNENGKIVNVASTLGKLTTVKNSDLQKQFLSDTIDREKLNNLAKQFFADVAANTYEEKGWISADIFMVPEVPAYSLSKVFLNIYTRILAKDEDIVKRNIQVYSLCPGWVRTDMAGPEAPKSLEEGVVTPTYVVNLPWTIDPKLQGRFFSEGEVTPLL